MGRKKDKKSEGHKHFMKFVEGYCYCQERINDTGICILCGGNIQ